MTRKMAWLNQSRNVNHFGLRTTLPSKTDQTAAAAAVTSSILAQYQITGRTPQPYPGSTPRTPVYVDISDPIYSDLHYALNTYHEHISTLPPDQLAAMQSPAHFNSWLLRQFTPPADTPPSPEKVPPAPPPGAAPAGTPGSDVTK